MSIFYFYYLKTCLDSFVFSCIIQVYESYHQKNRLSSLQNEISKYLVTSIFDETLTASDFKELYFLRWPIEQKYGELKNQYLIEEFSGATSTSIEQEFYINLMLSNLAAMIKRAADNKINESADPDNKYRYQSNRAFIIGRMKWFIARLFAKNCNLSIIDDIFEGACINRSQIQPGRKCKRNKRSSATERKHFNNRK